MAEETPRLHHHPMHLRLHHHNFNTQPHVPPQLTKIQSPTSTKNECTASSNFFIVLSCFNATADVLLLAIPVTLLWTLRIPLAKRIVVCVLLSSGIFIIAPCITRVSLTVVPDITIRIIARWGARDLSVALVAVNSASLRPMFCKSFWAQSNIFPQRDHPHGDCHAYRSVSAHRVIQALKRGHHRHGGLASTSYSTPTLEPFTQPQMSMVHGDEITASARAYQPDSSKWQRPFRSPGSFGSQVITNLA